MAQRDAMKSHGLPTWRMQNATAVSAVPAIHATCGRAGPGAPQIWEDHGGEGSYGTAERPDALRPLLRPEDLQGQQSYDLLEAKGSDF